jgi:hypothetical protein
MSELQQQAGLAIRLALQEQRVDEARLEGYLDEMTEEDLNELQAAASSLEDAISWVLGRRHS